MEVESLIGDTRDCDESVKFLVERHPEIESIKIGVLYGNLNRISDEGLQAILTLKQLKTVKLYNTGITGEGVDDLLISALHIQTFGIINCHGLTDEGLAEVLRVIGVNLERLYLRSTGISGEYNFPATFPNILELNLFYCWNLSDRGLCIFLKKCGPKLKLLDLGCNNFTGESLAEFTGAFLKVEKLNLEYCMHLTDSGLCNILRIFGKSLKYLDLNTTPITGEGLSEFRFTLSNLQRLDCYGCRSLTDKGLCEIFRICGGSLSALKVLHTSVSGEGLSEFQDSLPNITKLDFSCSNLTDQGLIELFRISGSNLKTLDIQETKITGEGLAKYDSTDLSIEQLNLLWCEKLTDRGLNEFLRLFSPSLKLLNIGYTSLTGKFPFKGTMANIVKLDLSGESIRDKVLYKMLAASGPNLRYLDLRSSHVTCEGLTAYDTHMSSIVEINLSHCKYITNKGLFEVLELCKDSLHYLDISNTIVSLEGIGKFQANLNALEELNLSGCEKINDQKFNELLRITGDALKRLLIDGTSISNKYKEEMSEKYPDVSIS